jgi:hypothetical protein
MPSLAWLGILVASTAHAGGGPVVYVDDSAPGGGDGSSWAAAFNFLQDGLSAASGSGATEIRVGQGTYIPDRSAAVPGGTGDRASTFSLLEDVSVLGGYAGVGMPDPNLRDVDLYVSTLSGDLAANDGPNFFNNGENAHHVVSAIGVGATAVIDGFTITGGNANDNGAEDTSAGGGIYVSLASPVINDCEVFENHVSDRGAGMFNGSSTAPMITNTNFRNNRADVRGGGMHNFVNASPTVTDCGFFTNSAGQDGGGIYNRSASVPLLTRVVFDRNSAFVGGGAWNFSGGAMFDDCDFIANSAGAGGGMYTLKSPTLTNCDFANNVATVGGGLYVDGGSAGGPNLRDCRFTSNLSGLDGGGYYTETGAGTLTDCVFTNNQAHFDGGAAYISSLATTAFSNTAFIGNDALDGGAIYSDLSTPSFELCSFTGNTGGFDGGRGGAMFNSGSDITVNTCIFDGNTCGGGEVSISRGGAMHNSASVPIVTDSTFTGNTASHGVGGAICNTGASDAEFTNCRFDGNSAGYFNGGGGGGIYIETSNSLLVNCIFSNNVAGGFGGANGGGIYIASGSPWIANVTVEGNSADVSGSGIFVEAGTPSLLGIIVWANNQGQIDGVPAFVGYSCGQGGYAGPGNIMNDPLFVDAGSGNYGLLPGSPCIDAGDNTAVPPGVLLDIVGNNRFIDDPDTADTGNGVAPIVDMGATEFQSTRLRHARGPLRERRQPAEHHPEGAAFDPVAADPPRGAGHRLDQLALVAHHRARGARNVRARPAAATAVAV